MLRSSVARPPMAPSRWLCSALFFAAGVRRCISTTLLTGSRGVAKDDGSDHVFRSYAASGRPTSSEPVLVQAYSGSILGRPPQDIEAMLSEGWVLSALLSYRYALKQGYNFVMFEYANVSEGSSGACVHPSRGPQDPNWCKVLAIRRAMDAFPNSRIFFWLDSDAVVRNMSLGLSHYLNSAPTMARHSCNHTGASPLSETSVYAWPNTHFTHCRAKKPHPWACSGAVVFQRGSSTTAFLDSWWSLSGSHMRHGAYDQPSFNMLVRHTPDAVILSEDPFSSKGQFLVHRCSSCTWMDEKRSLFTQIAKDNGLLPWDLSFANPALVINIT